MHTLLLHIFLMHDQQNPLTTLDYILYAPKPSCNIKHAKEIRGFDISDYGFTTENNSDVPSCERRGWVGLR